MTVETTQARIGFENQLATSRKNSSVAVAKILVTEQGIAKFK